MSSDLEPSSDDLGRTLPFHPVWIAAFLAVLALAWWLVRPERANPLPRGEANSGVLAAPPTNASVEFYEGTQEGGAADPALDPRARAANTPAPGPVRGVNSPAQRPPDSAGPDVNIPRDLAALPPGLGARAHGPGSARFAGRRPPPPHDPFDAFEHAGAPPCGPGHAHPHDGEDFERGAPFEHDEHGERHEHFEPHEHVDRDEHAHPARVEAPRVEPPAP